MLQEVRLSSPSSLNLYANFDAQLFQRKKDEASEKASQAKSSRSSQFKVVSKRDSVLLPEQGHPAGWVNRQQERADAAKEGQEWRSKAFSIIQPAT